MTRLRTVAGAFLFMTLAVSIAACSGGSSTESTVTSTTIAGDRETSTTMAEETPVDIVFRIGVVGGITTDNWWASHDSDDTPQNQALLGGSKTALFDLSLPGFVPVARMAATPAPVEAVQEGDVWVVEQPIRGDVTWSDGEPVTAGDLAFYFDTVRRLALQGGHAERFGSSVLSVTAPNPRTVRVEFQEQPSLSVWQNGVALAPFVPAHFWEEPVDAAVAAAEAATREITAEDALSAILEAVNGDDDPTNDLDEAEVTEEMISQRLAVLWADAGRNALYTVSGVGEPSAGPMVVVSREPGSEVVTTANDSYFDRGTETTLYSDGSVRVANPDRDEDVVFSGSGAGAVLAHLVDGPFVTEVHWLDRETRQSAYEDLAAGELDYVLDPIGLTSGMRSQLAADPDLRFSTSPAEGFRFLAFNLRKAPLSDLAFRRAVATVIDKELVAEGDFDGDLFPAYTVVHPDLILYYNTEVERPGWADGDPMDTGTRFETAIQILRDAGYTWDSEPVVVRDSAGAFVEVNPKGSGLTMPNETPVPDMAILAPGPDYDPFRAIFATRITAALQDLGIPVEVETHEFETIVDMIYPPQTPETALQWDMAVLGWAGSDPAQPGTALRAFFHSEEDVVTGGGYNLPGYHSEVFDALADELALATNNEAAAELTKQMEAVIAGDLPYVVLYRTPVIESFDMGVTFPVESIMGGHHGFPGGWPGAVTLAG